VSCFALALARLFKLPLVHGRQEAFSGPALPLTSQPPQISDLYLGTEPIGTATTDYPHVPYDVDLIRCLRYLPSVPPAAATQYVGNGINSSTTTSIISIPLPVTPRSVPTGLIVTGTPKVNEITGSAVTTSVTFNTGGYSASLISAAVAAGLTVNRPTVLELPASASLLFTGCEL
jgi:hypothetical protein